MIRSLVAAAAVLLVSGASALAQQLPLDAVSRYLNGLQSAKSPFTQINADGTISTGTVYIKRPGKVRFEYDPPEQAMVLASAGAVYIFDRKLGGQPDTYPLRQTPLSIILERKVDLARAGMVTGHAYDGTATSVTAQDPRRPDIGSIQMKFTGPPVELRQWIITDGQGTKTTVILGALEETRLANNFFYVDNFLEKED